jgi:3-oxoacyl-[acyl-carrier-protein] synthase-3
MTQSILRGVGSYLPEKVLTNKDLEENIDTTDEWIKERTGISQRHVAAENEYTSDLAVVAAKKALKNAEMSIQDIDLIIVGNHYT